MLKWPCCPASFSAMNLMLDSLRWHSSSGAELRANHLLSGIQFWGSVSCGYAWILLLWGIVNSSSDWRKDSCCSPPFAGTSSEVSACVWACLSVPNEMGAKRVLIVTTSHGAYPDNGEPTGLWWVIEYISWTVPSMSYLCIPPRICMLRSWISVNEFLVPEWMMWVSLCEVMKWWVGVDRRLEELAAPYLIWTKAGLEVDIVSVKGGKVPLG